MKTKNMRKKALVSSLAMLLVAVVALSGATYAWFAANSQAKMNTISLTTSQKSSLLIAQGIGTNGTTQPADDQFKSELVANWSQLLLPCSTTNYTGFITLNPTNEKIGGNAQTVAGLGSATANADTTDGGYLYKKIFFKADTATDITLTSITPTAGTTSIASAVRIAFVSGAHTNLYGLGAEQTYNGVKGVKQGQTYDAANPSTYEDFYAADVSTVDFLSMTAKLADGSDTIAEIGEGGGVVGVDVYIWLEGNDRDCVNSISGGSLTNLQFQFDVA